MANFMAVSIWMKVALVCLLLGTLLFVIGFATVPWMVFQGYRSTWRAHGLWKYLECDHYQCHYGSWGSWAWLNDNLDYLRATQAMECIGLICDLIALLVLLMYLFVGSCRRRNALIAVIVIIFAAVFFITVGIAVFAIKLDSHGFSVGWSMGLAIVGDIFIFIAGIMCILIASYW